MNPPTLSTLFQHNIQTNSFSHAYLIYGINEAELQSECLTIISNYLSTHYPNISYDHIDTLNHPDLYQISHQESIKIETIKQIQAHIQYAPHCLKKSFVIINNCHNLTTQAANAFLKTLEEPPKDIIFFLLTTKFQSILETIKSRCNTIYYHCKTTPAITEQYIDLNKFIKLSLNEKLNFSKSICEKKSDVQNQCNYWLNQAQHLNINYTHPIYGAILTCLKNLNFNINLRLHVDNLCLQINRQLLPQ